MSEYTTHLRTRRQQRYWYLTNGTVLREPRLLSTPAERRFAFSENPDDTFWATELHATLDKWAKDEAARQDAEVVFIPTNIADTPGVGWAHDALVERLRSWTIRGTYDTGDTELTHGHDMETTFVFCRSDRPELAVVVVSLSKTRNYNLGEWRYTVNVGAHRARPLSTVMHEDEGHKFPTGNYSKCDQPLSELFPDETAFDDGQTASGANKELVSSTDYMLAVTTYLNICSRIDEYEETDNGLPALFSNFNHGLIAQAQAVLDKTETIDRLSEALSAVQATLRELGFVINDGAAAWQLAMTGEATIKFKSEKAGMYSKASAILSLPLGDIFFDDEAVVSTDEVTMYEMARNKAKREGTIDSFDGAMSAIANSKTFESYTKARETLDRAVSLLPITTNH